MIGLAGLIALAALGSLVLELTAPPKLPGTPGPVPGMATVVALVLLIAGAPIAARRPGHPIGQVFLGTAFGWGLSGILEQLVVRASASGGPYPPALVLLAWMLQGSWVPLVIPVVVLVPQFFPDGRLLSRRWRFLPPLTWTGIAILLAGPAFGDYDVIPGLRNPFMLAGPWGEVSLAAGMGVVLLAALFTVATLVMRARRGTRIERQQLRVMLAAAVIWPVTAFFGGLTSTFSGPPSIVFQALGFLGLLALPAAIAIAILRYRLYDIDVVIKRTVVYAALLAVLLAMYAFLVIVVGALARPLTGSSEIAVAGSTLVVLLLFQPLRTWILRAVDRQFSRAQYDAQRTIDAFAEQLRDEIDLAALDTELTRVVYTALNPSYVSLWLRRP